MESSRPQDVNAGKKEASSSLLPERLRSKIGFDLATILVILKAAVPQTIAIAMYQSRTISDKFTTLGYLIAIASVLGFAPLPRAVFIQTMFISILAICIGSSVALFAIWTAIQARKHTTPPGTIPQAYNSSDSAVCAVWLFFQMYLVNSLRAARPHLQIPSILYSIFAVVSMVYGPQFPDMSTGISFIKKLLETFLTGFGLTTSVSLFLLPVSQRGKVFKELSEYLQSLRGVIKSQISYTSSLEQFNRGQSSDEGGSESKSNPSKPKNPGHRPPTLTYTSEAATLKTSTETLKGLHAKLSGDLTFAKREIAYGKLSPNDLSLVFKFLRGILIPLIGMSSLIEIFERVAKWEGWDAQDQPNEKDERNNASEWQKVMSLLHAPLAEIGGAVDLALEHILLRLELVKLSKLKPGSIDEESKGDAPQPNTNEFASWFGCKTDEFYNSRKITLRNWCEQRGIELPEGSNSAGKFEQFDLSQRNENQRQLYVVLYIEYLLYSVSRATLDLVYFADSKVVDGTIKSNRIIMPGYRRLKKWMTSVFSVNDRASTNLYDASLDGYQDVYLGQAFRDRKDPEHLPPANTWEKIGDLIRFIPRLLRSDHSMFGFRVACATLSIGIVAYLRDSNLFFVQQRLVWSLVMVAISMARTSGQSLFNFLLRIFGTVCATVASYLVYYIPDGHTAGIIVFVYVWEAICFSIVITKPRFAVVGVIAAITVILIVGYELQVRTIGVAASAASGQQPYGINVLAPFRLACVVGGLAVAWFWTIFPFPVTEHSEVRKDVGAALYLLANFYAIVHETVRARVRGDEGDAKILGSPGAKLERAKQKVLWKSLVLIDRLKTNSRFSRWEFAVGGRFPRQTYSMLIDCAESILSFSALISYTSQTFASEGNSTTKWQNDFNRLLKHAGATSHEITSRLCLLSSAVSNGTPLPPYLKELEPYGLTENLRAIDTDILNVRHMVEPGYAAFAVIHIAGRSIVSDLNELTEYVATPLSSRICNTDKANSIVKGLVGELDFSFHVISTLNPDKPVSSSAEVSSSKEP